MERVVCKYDQYPPKINTWKRKAIINTTFLFNGNKPEKKDPGEKQAEKLHAQIGLPK
jgi:hypothetical protein